MDMESWEWVWGERSIGSGHEELGWRVGRGSREWATGHGQRGVGILGNVHVELGWRVGRGSREWTWAEGGRECTWGVGMGCRGRE